MKESNLLRLALIINAGNTQTFNSSLIKLIQMILYEKSEYSINVDTIRNRISENYELEFTNEEILKAINSKDAGVECIEETRTTKLGSNKHQEILKNYRLKDKILEKFKTNEEENPLRVIIDNYIDTYKIENHTADQIEQILNKFLYHIFNSNKKTLLLLLNDDKSKLLNHTYTNFTEDEKRLINDFLNWDEDSKNSFIFKAVSYSVDYCMLTIKKDFSSYRDLFNGKVFYLDTNVIFRMAGINNEERRSVTNSFIKKCKDNNITIKYTNITYQEVLDTINRQVHALKGFYNGKRPVDTAHYQAYSKPYDNLDFIRLYDKWCKLPGTKYNDYSGFQKHIIKEIDYLLADFKKVDFTSFAIQDTTSFKGFEGSLKEYKTKYNANCTEKSVSNDVNNFMFVKRMRESKQGYSFVDISDYFITTDANLYEWGKEILPSAIPIAVLPSVWHSLLLKFKGRTNDDYKAFTLFLNLRYRVSDEGFDKRRPDILSIVQNMDDAVDLKNLILTEISDNLSEKYKDFEDVNEIIEDAKEEVIEREANRYFKEEAQPLLDEGKAAGKLETIYRLAESRAQKKIDKQDKIFIWMDNIKLTTGILLTIGFLGFVILNGMTSLLAISKTEIHGYDIVNWVSIILFFLGLITKTLVEPIKNKYFNKEYETLKKAEIEKLMLEVENI